ncbi:CHCH domain-containing protein [Diaporthe helianthi]|uniref:CHCH domain-containing protein n=1 Tax=Diaporthe helianthi TaxID=158607 RepID=A0A2P5ICC8_DIAHE|nr:CHCH domain-containing protein [Diaporthe helianthi]
MPRQRSAGRAPSRPTVPSRAPAAPTSQQQTRPATSYAAPATQAPHQPAPQASQGPGLFGQMASTAAGVAVGSSIGHAIGGMFGGGGSAEAPAQASPQAAQQTQNDQWGPNCSLATKSFTNCMDEHQGNMSICGWYMEQLKACQAAASQY